MFRGNGFGCVAGNIPSKWNDNDYRWRRKLGSRDVGTPVVIGNSIFMMVSKPERSEIALESIDLTTGQLKWSKAYPHPTYHMHARNTRASTTPSCNKTHVYFAFADPEHTYLKCLTHDGNEVWSRDFGTFQGQHGFGMSPRIVDDLIVLMNEQQADELPAGVVPGDSRMIAVDRITGKDAWTTSLKSTRESFGVPGVFRSSNGQTQVIDANTGNGMFGIDLKTGKMLWSLPVFDKRCCSTPIISGDLAIASCGSGGGGNRLIAVKIPTKPDEGPQQVYAVDRFAPYVPTSALKDGRLYMMADNGIVSAIDVKSGESIWSNRIGGNFGASPLIVGDKLLVISLEGKATILATGDEYKVLGEVDLGGPVGASPIYAGGNLLLRVDQELLCLGGQST
jgi:outer membrane protein assembly factor BamB